MALNQNAWALGDPMQKRNYYRAGWIRFTEDADVTSVINTLSEKKVIENSQNPLGLFTNIRRLD